MKLSIICEYVKLNAEQLVSKLRSIPDIKAWSYSPHVVSLEVYPDDMEKCKAIIKHSKWQIHSYTIGKRRRTNQDTNEVDVAYIDATPLRNERYAYNTDELYHITDISKLDRILANGLLIKSDTPGMKFPRRIYLYPSKDMAISRYRMASRLNTFANKANFRPALLRIDNSKHKYDTFIDPEYYMGMGGNADDLINVPIYTTKRILPSDISVINVWGR